MLTDHLNHKKSGSTFLPPRLSGSTLKWIALLTMLIDHIGAVLLECGVLQAYSQHLPTALSYEASYSVFQADLIIRQIGRISFPIFCFLLVEGFHYTSNRKKYALRLFFFALLSEIPFDLALQGTFLEFSYQNVLFTLLFGFLTLWAMEKAKEIHPGLSLIPAGLGLLVGYFFHSDYDWKGICTDSHSPCILLLPSGKNHCRLSLPFSGNPLPAWHLYHLNLYNHQKGRSRSEILLLSLLSGTSIGTVSNPIRYFPHLNCQKFIIEISFPILFRLKILSLTPTVLRRFSKFSLFFLLFSLLLHFYFYRCCLPEPLLLQKKVDRYCCDFLLQYQDLIQSHIPLLLHLPALLRIFSILFLDSVLLPLLLLIFYLILHWM